MRMRKTSVLLAFILFITGGISYWCGQSRAVTVVSGDCFPDALPTWCSLKCQPVVGHLFWWEEEVPASSWQDCQEYSVDDSCNEVDELCDTYEIWDKPDCQEDHTI